MRSMSSPVRDATAPPADAIDPEAQALALEAAARDGAPYCEQRGVASAA